VAAQRYALGKLSVPAGLPKAWGSQGAAELRVGSVGSQLCAPSLQPGVGKDKTCPWLCRDVLACVCPCVTPV